MWGMRGIVVVGACSCALASAPGTAMAKPKLVKDITPSGSSNIYLSFAFDDRLYFGADDGSHGGELWRSDGTKNGTKIVREIGPGSAGSGINYLDKANGRLFFNSDDGVHDDELWRSDGTKDGTKLVKDIFPGDSSFSNSFAGFGDITLFSARNAKGYEAWRTNGTEQGTKLIERMRRQ